MTPLTGIIVMKLNRTQGNIHSNIKQLKLKFLDTIDEIKEFFRFHIEREGEKLERLKL